MKKIELFLTIILMFVTIINAQAKINTFNNNSLAHKNNQKNTQFDFFEWDKLKHFTTSFYLTTTSFYFLDKIVEKQNTNALKESTVFSISCGLGKEIFNLYNGDNGNFEFLDMIANMFGTITGLLIINGIIDG